MANTLARTCLIWGTVVGVDKHSINGNKIKKKGIFDKISLKCTHTTCITHYIDS